VSYYNPKENIRNANNGGENYYSTHARAGNRHNPLSNAVVSRLSPLFVTGGQKQKKRLPPLSRGKKMFYFNAGPGPKSAVLRPENRKGAANRCEL